MITKKTAKALIKEEVLKRTGELLKGLNNLEEKVALALGGYPKGTRVKVRYKYDDYEDLVEPVTTESTIESLGLDAEGRIQYRFSNATLNLCDTIEILGVYDSVYKPLGGKK